MITASSMAGPLLTTKLYIPPPRPNLVLRPRLIQRLDEGLQAGRRLTLISAPAGFGKTTLVAEWLHCRGEVTLPLPVVPGLHGIARIGWLSLDEDDNDPARFLAYLVAALQTVQPGMAGGILAALHAPKPPSLQALLTPLINEVAALRERVTLILDDYHLIEAPAVHEILSFLLDHLPANMHLVIATRADPPLPIARLRGRGQLSELRQADLRFTPDEAAEFLKRVMGLELAAEQVAALNALTEGWVAGLQMAALSMQGCQDVHGFIAAFTGSQHYILDYLIEEVLHRQPESVQSFLLQTSILERLTGSLCDALLFEDEGRKTKDEGRSSFVLPPPARPAVPGRARSASILEYLEHANLFVVPLDDRQEWYRYHHLFADLLRHRLDEVYPGLAPALHRRASRWYEGKGQSAEAIDHALAGQDFERAARLVEQAAEATMMRSQVATFHNWMEALPGELLRTRPLLHVYHAWALLLSGHPLEDAQASLLRAEQADASGSVAGAVTTFHALMAAYQGDTRRCVELSQRALELLPEESLFLRSLIAGFLGLNRYLSGDVVAARQALEEAVDVCQKAGNLMNMVLALVHLGDVSYVQGQLSEAQGFYDRAFQAAVDGQGRRQPIAGLALIGLGHLLRERNDLQAAERHLLEGIELIKRWGEVGAVNGYIALARIRQAQGDLAAAQAAVETARQIALRFDAMQMEDYSVAVSQARLWVAQGNLPAAARWASERNLEDALPPIRGELEGGQGPGSPPLSLLRVFEYIMLAEVRLAQGRPDQTLSILRPLLDMADDAGWMTIVVYILVLQARALQAQGEESRALAALERALCLARPQGLVRVFLDAGEPMAALLELAAGRRAPAAAYARRLLAASGVPFGEAEGKEAPAPWVEPLSQREVQVLRLLASKLSSAEMARELVVSVHTVRSHVKSIYAKLDVHSRYEAVARARELKLL